jgi:hypothetical protein
MSYRVACELGDRIRGVIPFVGSIGVKQLGEVPRVEKSAKVMAEMEAMTMTAYNWDPSFKKEEWNKLEDAYSCKPSPNTNWLIINGR